MQSGVLTADQLHRFQGLTRHLKITSSSTDRDKMHRHVMTTNIEALMPEESTDALQAEFQQRCCFGDRTNLELMSSAKWMKLLRDCGAVAAQGAPERRAHVSIAGCIKAAEADLIFSKVLTSAEVRDTKRLTYGLFCKALYLVAMAIYPEQPGEDAFAALVARILPGGGADSSSDGSKLTPTGWEDAAAPMLDADAVQVLGHFRPALDDLFMVVCSSDTGKAADNVCSSASTARLRERPSVARRGNAPSLMGTSHGYPCEKDASAVAALAAISAGANVGAAISDLGMGAIPDVLESDESDCEDEGDLEYEASVPRWGSPLIRTPLATIMERADSNPPTPTGAQEMPFPQFGGAIDVPEQRVDAAATAVARGNRARQMSLDQLLHICKELQIVPHLLAKPEVIHIFKRAQGSDLLSSGSPGTVSIEGFHDIFAQCAIKSHSKPPYGEVYQREHEKIYAFFVAVLPSKPRELHERFLYSRSGR